MACPPGDTGHRRRRQTRADLCRAGGSASFIYMIYAEDDRRIRQITDAAQQLDYCKNRVNAHHGHGRNQASDPHKKSRAHKRPTAGSLSVHFRICQSTSRFIQKEYGRRLPGVRIRLIWRNINKASGGAAASAVYRIVSIPIFCMCIPIAR